jgi:hypothetical protein
MPKPKFQTRPGDAEHDATVHGVCEMAVQTRLQQVFQPFADDMVIGPPHQLPLFEGLEDESLVCPGCEQDITTGVSGQTLQALFKPPGRLLFHCKCDAYAEIVGPRPSGHS